MLPIIKVAQHLSHPNTLFSIVYNFTKLESLGLKLFIPEVCLKMIFSFLLENFRQNGPAISKNEVKENFILLSMLKQSGNISCEKAKLTQGQEKHLGVY